VGSGGVAPCAGTTVGYNLICVGLQITSLKLDRLSVTYSFGPINCCVDVGSKTGSQFNLILSSVLQSIPQSVPSIWALNAAQVLPFQTVYTLSTGE
jgi:hypothetical protein